MKRILSLLLALSMCLGMLPANAWAETAEESTEYVEQTENFEEIEETTIPEETEEVANPEETEAMTIPEETEEVAIPEETEETMLSEEVEEAAFSEAAEEEFFSQVWINPEYEDLYSESDILEEGYASYDASRAKQCATLDQVIAALREGLVNREEQPTAAWVMTETLDASVLIYIMDHLFDHTGVPYEGDYLQRDIGCYSIGCRGGGAFIDGVPTQIYTFWLENIKYYTTAAQEQEMDREASRVLASLNLAGKTQKEKIDAIYSYLVHNVKYVSDAELNDKSNVIKYSSYAALVQKNAVCQGFAGAFYRLCMESGINSRIISSNNMNHAWNIVALNGSYYYVDATWDINWPDAPRYYLKGTVSWLRDHKNSNTHNISELGDEYLDLAFAAAYSVPEGDYRDSVAGTVVASGECGENLTWTLDKEGTLTISGTGSMENYNSVYETPWKEDIQSVVLKNGVTSIGSCAFDKCGSLTSVTIPDSVTHIGRSAFYVCSSLTSVTIPESVTSIGTNAFTACRALTSVTIPGSVTSIGDGVFKDCQNLEVVTIQNGVTDIGDATFAYCSSLTSVTIPEGVTSIGAFVFTKCSSLISVTLPTSVTSIGNGAFSECDALKDVYYSGSDRQWQEIEIADGNDFLAGAQIHCAEHIHNLQLVPAKAATCTVLGRNAFYVCKTCGQVFKDKNGTQETTVKAEVIQPAGHKEAVDKAVEATCTAPGKTEGKHCSVCGEVLTAQKEISAKGHKEAVDQKVEPTCIDTGKTEGKHCPVCNEVLKAQETIPALGHNFEDHVCTRCQVPEKGCTVAFDGNGAESGEAKAVYAVWDTDVELPLCGFARTGYTFTAWNTQADGKGKTYLPGDKVKNLADTGTVTLYAQWEAIRYVLHFEANGGEGTVADQSVAYGQTAALPARGFAQTGFRFVGWNTQPDGTGTAFTPGEEVKDLLSEAGTLTLYVQWEEVDYILVFDANGGEGEMEPITLKFTEQLTLPREGFTYTGRHLIGWNTQPDGTGTAFDLGGQAQSLAEGGTATLYAQWGINTYTIHFETGTPRWTVEDTTMDYDSTIFLPGEGINIPGLALLGWNTEEDGSGESYAPGQAVSKLAEEGTVTLYAQWMEKGYLIAFDGNGEDVQGTTDAVKAPLDTDVTIPECGFTRHGYTFTAWNTMKNGKGKTYKPGTTVKNLAKEGTVTLYAQWKANTYTAHFQPGVEGYTGTTKPMPNLTHGKTYAAPKCGFTRTGYVFTGWQLDEEHIYKAGQKFTVDGQDLVFTAQWEPITYKVRFNANKGTGKMADQGIKYDEPTALKENEFTRKGYHFIGWNTRADGKGTGYENKEEVENLAFKDKAVVTMYAQWEGNEYTLTFHGEDGVTRTQTLRYGTAEVLEANTFTKPGYTFKGWTARPDGKGTLYKDKAKVTNLGGGEDTDLYAQWTANKYTVVFHSNLPRDTVKKQILTFDGKPTALSANSFTRKGYTFQGWAEAADGAVVYANKEQVQNLTTEKSLDLYAVWKAHAYTITFVPNGAEGEETTLDMVYDEEKVLTPNSYERPGYTFSGWSTTAKGKAVHTDGKTVKNLTDREGAVVRLYAVWTPTSYTVTFVPGEGGTGTMKPVKMIYGRTYVLSGVTFKRPYYTFTGWLDAETGEPYTNKQKVHDLTTDGSAVTLVAQWTPTKYTITYKNLTAMEAEALEFPTYDVTTTAKPGTPARPGWKFDGWYLDAKFKKKFESFNTAKPAKVTLYAKWTRNETIKYTVLYAADPKDTGVTGDMSKVKQTGLVCGKDYAPKACSFKRPGYLFDGWLLPDGKTVITTKQKFSNLSTWADEDGNVTLTATWKPITYKVRFNANKGTGKMADQTGILYDVSTELNSCTLKRPGYTFAGWTTKANGTGTVYGDGASVKNLTKTNNGTVILYAKWTKN